MSKSSLPSKTKTSSILHVDSRCFSATTHLIQINGSFTDLCRPWWQADGDPFLWIRCVVAEKHLRHAGQRPSRTGFGQPWFRASCKCIFYSLLWLFRTANIINVSTLPTASCGPPPKVRNASIFGKTQHRYETNAIVRYHCVDGFQQRLNPLIRCLSGGRWERPQILCIPGKIRNIFNKNQETWLYQQSLFTTCMLDEYKKNKMKETAYKHWNVLLLRGWRSNAAPWHDITDRQWLRSSWKWVWGNTRITTILGHQVLKVIILSCFPKLTCCNMTRGK